MTFEVEWNQEAVQQLAALWSTAPDQGQVTAASHAIDQALARDPLNEGESRSHGRRVILVHPLGVMYRVYPHGRTVDVLRCWHHG